MERIREMPRLIFPRRGPISNKPIWHRIVEQKGGANDLKVKEFRKREKVNSLDPPDTFVHRLGDPRAAETDSFRGRVAKPSRHSQVDGLRPKFW